MLDRRQFLASCSVAAASALLPAGVLASGDRAIRPSRQLFLTLIGQSFRGLDGHNVALNFILLDIVQERKTPGLERFTLLFEETYRISHERFGGLIRMVHPDTGSMLMHLEPSTRGPRVYTAHFSLLS